MTGVSHKQFAWSWAAGACIVLEPYWGLSGCVAVLLGAHAGSTAPDWLEFGVVRHRTLTHLPWLWILMYALSVSMVVHYNLGILAACAVTGFCLGALSHLFGDYGTPMGIPLVTPSKRSSINMWGYGRFSEKVPIVIAWLLVVGLAALRFHFAPAEWASFFAETEKMATKSAGMLKGGINW